MSPIIRPSQLAVVLVEIAAIKNQTVIDWQLQCILHGGGDNAQVRRRVILPMPHQLRGVVAWKAISQVAQPQRDNAARGHLVLLVVP